MATIHMRTTYASMRLSPLRLSVEMVSIQGSQGVLLAVGKTMLLPQAMPVTVPMVITHLASSGPVQPGRLIVLALPRRCRAIFLGVPKVARITTTERQPYVAISLTPSQRGTLSHTGLAGRLSYDRGGWKQSAILIWERPHCIQRPFRQATAQSLAG